MTFVEAAVQILRREGKPLHIKELTRLAIKHNLLSVVGRDPEAMMETRLLIEAKRPSADLVRVSPGIFGLRVYPPRSERGEAVKAEGDKVTKPKAEATASPAKDRADRGGKRRRSGRATDSPEAVLAANPAEVVAPTSTATPAATPSSVSPAPVKASEPAPAETAAKPAAAKSRRRTRDRAPDRSLAPAPAATIPESPTPAAAPPPAIEAVAIPGPSAAPPAAPSAVTPRPVATPALEPMAVPAAVPTPVPSAVSPVRSAVPPASHLTPIPAAATPSAKTPIPPPVDTSKPTVLPAPPVVPAVVAPVTPEKRPTEGVIEPKQETPRPERHSGHGHREERPTGGHREERQHGHPREERGSNHPREERSHPREERGPAPPREDRAAAPPREDRPAPSATTPAPNNQSQSQPQQPRQMSLADAAYDVMRGASDGRALTHRQIAEIAVKRRLVRGELVDVSRAIRVALVREQRHRDSEGLRPRIRTLGPGQYALGERKLEPELYNAERELLDRASRTREATRVALRRRLRQLPPGAFELMMRLLLERMGMVGAEIVKRGEGVAYYGGNISRGGRSLKVLVAIRPGEGELSREAVAELRAGVRLRSFDEGLVLCAARAGGAALTELAAAPGIELYDQDALTELLIRQHLGVRRMHLPVDYLDTELFNELLDQG